MGELESNAKMQQHLAHCLVCRACEDMCPSGVRYGRIIDGIRQHQYSDSEKLPLPVSDMDQLLRYNRRLWWYQKSGLQKLVRGLHLFGNSSLARKESLLPVITRQQTWKEHYPVSSSRKGEVQLFTGCVGNSLDHQTLRDALKVLNQIGYDVSVPPAQACCGALDQHSGNQQGAESLAEKNRSAFEHHEIPVISLHSGCTTTLSDSMDNRVMDVCDFILHEKLLPEFSPLNKRVLVHAPCTKKHALHSAENVSRVLETIPGLDVTNLPADLPCCGAAGSYMLDFPTQADAIREPSIKAIRDADADILVTSNIGCAMHLQAGLRQAGIHTRIMHPVSLIAEQLQD